MFMEEESSLSIISILENYGWYILGLGIIVGCLWAKFEPQISKFFEKKREHEYAAKYHKDSDLLTERLTAQQYRVIKLQEEYEKRAEEHKKKMEEKEAKKREEYLKETEGCVSGNKLGRGSLKQDYNPLMGDSSRSYKPVKKTPCSGGGCGR